MKRIVVLTGAGISAESGIKTFRDADGLWEGRDVMEVASPQGWAANQPLVQDFYNQRRRQLKEVVPNAGHRALVDLEEKYDVRIVTQNVDDLHERAGSSNILHLHGQLKQVRSSIDESLVYDWTEDLTDNDKCDLGSQLRPHIVWFGEAVPAIEDAAAICATADILLVIGTSMVVYPAAGLVDFVPSSTMIYVIDPKAPEVPGRSNVIYVKQPSGTGLPIVAQQLLNDA